MGLVGQFDHTHGVQLSNSAQDAVSFANKTDVLSIKIIVFDNSFKPVRYSSLINKQLQFKLNSSSTIDFEIRKKRSLFLPVKLMPSY